MTWKLNAWDFISFTQASQSPEMQHTNLINAFIYQYLSSSLSALLPSIPVPQTLSSCLPASFLPVDVVGGREMPPIASKPFPTEDLRAACFLTLCPAFLPYITARTRGRYNGLTKRNSSREASERSWAVLWRRLQTARPFIPSLGSTERMTHFWVPSSLNILTLPMAFVKAFNLIL